MFYINGKVLGIFLCGEKILKYKEKKSKNWEGNWCFTSTNNKEVSSILNFVWESVHEIRNHQTFLNHIFILFYPRLTNKHTCHSKNGWKHHSSSQYILYTWTSTGQVFHRTNLMRGKHVWWKTLDTFTGSTLRSISQIL